MIAHFEQSAASNASSRQDTQSLLFLQESSRSGADRCEGHHFWDLGKAVNCSNLATFTLATGVWSNLYNNWNAVH